MPAADDEAQGPPLLPEEARAVAALDRQVERPQPRRERPAALRIERCLPPPEDLTPQEVRTRLVAGVGPAVPAQATAAVIPAARFGEVVAAGGPFGWAEQRFGPGAYRAVWVAKDLRELSVESFVVPDLDAAREAREREWWRRVEADAAERARARREARDRKRADAAARAFVAAVLGVVALDIDAQRALRRDAAAYLLADEPRLLREVRGWVVVDRLFAAFAARLGLVRKAPRIAHGVSGRGRPGRCP